MSNATCKLLTTSARIVNNPRIEWLSPDDPPNAFPAVATALKEPDGLLAAGGDLSQQRLLAAYTAGIFPWYEEGQPILWWSPDPRCIIEPANLHISKRLSRYVKRSSYTVSFDSGFAAVIDACAGARSTQHGTWITPAIRQAFIDLHDAGWAHSVEVWDDDDLAGGIYGLSIGRVFFGESMFSHRDNASKFAMLALCSELLHNDFDMLDCQVVSQHLLSLGACLIPRTEFTGRLARSCEIPDQFSDWPAKRAPIADFLPN